MSEVVYADVEAMYGDVSDSLSGDVTMDETQEEQLSEQQLEQQLEQLRTELANAAERYQLARFGACRSSAADICAWLAYKDDAARLAQGYIGLRANAAQDGMWSIYADNGAKLCCASLIGDEYHLIGKHGGVSLGGFLRQLFDPTCAEQIRLDNERRRGRR